MSLSTNLFYYLPFNGSIVPVVGTSATNAQGTLSYGTGILGQALDFGSTHQGYVSISSPYILSVNNVWSLNAWVNFPSYGAGGALVVQDESNAGGDEKWFLGPSGMLWGVGNSQATDLPLSTGVWTMITLASDGTSVYYYTNAVKSTVTANAQIRGHSRLSIRDIGEDVNFSFQGNGFRGLMCEYAAWDRQLSDSDVIQLYNGGAGQSLQTISQEARFKRGFDTGLNAGVENP